jgi:N-succinyldiaminopimelate aminotransferase
LTAEVIYVTSMGGWGEARGAAFVRSVFPTEPCRRLKGIGGKLRAALERCRVELNAGEAQ